MALGEEVDQQQLCKNILEKDTNLSGTNLLTAMKTTTHFVMFKIRKTFDCERQDMCELTMSKVSNTFPTALLYVCSVMARPAL